MPELINFSDGQMAPAEVAHEYIPCEKSLRVPCTSYLVRKEMEQLESNQESQVLVFVDSIETAAKCQQSLESMLHKLKRVGDGTQRVGLLLDSMNIDERGDTLEKFRYIYLRC